ncbi:MAG TPA: ATP-grasp domain-containing protein, partial [Methylophilaceae bacterium]|nr:ATP-grasp domain-containing protein [Methylophilaceae bacterium]
MNLHEFQAKQLLQSYGLPVPRSRLAESALAAVDAANALGGEAWVVKAQIHAGGRGKAGGVKVVKTVAEVQALSTALLSQPLVTYQNAPEGQPVHKLLVEETLPIARELYLSLLVDRSLERVVMVASSAGGMDIEEIARSHPEQILQEACDPLNGLVDYQARNLAFALGLAGEQIGAFTRLAEGLYRLFKENDLALLEINPLVVTTDGALVALDCKMSVDDNALYRQKGLAAQRDWSQDDVKEAEAHNAGLNYITLNGNIGCMVNGAGLAMA